jgi:ATP-dependent DNA helicase RecG
MNLQSPITSGNRALKMYSGRLANLNIFTYEDFLFHLPSRYQDFSIFSKISEVQEGETVTIKGQVLQVKNQYLRGNRIKTIQKALITDGTGKIELLWFNQPYLTKTLKEGSTVSLSGRVERTRNGFSINSPEYEVLFGEGATAIHTARLVPIYPETKGVSSKWLRRQIYNILSEFGDKIIDPLPDELQKRHGFMGLKKALEQVHFPTTIAEAQKARERLGFDELFLIQLAANKRRMEWNETKKTNPIYIEKYKKNIDSFTRSLPFTLTDSQNKAIDEIFSDISKVKPMNRLLQGDVGSGKTVVAAIAMYASYLNGFQSVLMAPTEILASQHFKTIENLLTPLGVRVKIVTGSKKLTDAFDILVGTHAVLSEKIVFDNLSLVVIDEQQRFGVAQRGIIRGKGASPHLLTMTATPIPRTVALTMYGDLDLSYLRELPQDRKRVKTWLVPPEKRLPAYEWIRKQINETKSQAFIICPFIEESESMQTVKAAKVEYEKLKQEIFPDLRLDILHGKLKGKEKEEVLTRFRHGDFDILVATPVVEVGIDIPNSTIIMIEASERFGLAQLHQLRGRVGRGEKQSFCLLFTDTEKGQNSQRLKGMETLHSGAELAELDLKLRGPGDMYGTNQHGIPKLKAATFADTILIQRAKHEADRIFPQIIRFPELLKKINTLSIQKVSPD